MKYTVKPEVFELNLDLCFGIIIARGLKNTATTEAEMDRLTKAQVQARAAIPADALKTQPVIAGYRQVLEKAGINPNKYVNSMEAMMKRILKGGDLSSINSLVDLCNSISIENQVSLGGHDLADIKADLSVQYTGGGEKFLPFGASEYEIVEPGELVFTSGNVVQTRKWVWRQSELGKMTLDTREVFFQLVGFDCHPGSPLASAMDALEEVLQQKCEGSINRYIVTKDQPEIEF